MNTFGLNNGILLRIIGILLIVFAAQLRMFSNNLNRQKLIGWYASISDIIWVLGSIIVITLQPLEITQTGNLIIAFLALIVSYFAVSQLNAIAKEISSYELSRNVNIPSSVLWPVISDVGGFVKYADSLSSTKVTKGHGVGMIRRCLDLKDQGWNETCISWVEGEMYSMEVDTNDYPYPFHKFQGTWSVSSLNDESSIIALKYDYIPKYGIVGRIMTNRMFSKLAADIINKIIDNYVNEAKKIQIVA
ncbi:MAG: SRPBCC family protein [Candidatus Kariarchaeaceae archaeon]